MLARWWISPSHNSCHADGYLVPAPFAVRLYTSRQMTHHQHRVLICFARIRRFLPRSKADHNFACSQYESLGMSSHYRVWEESFVGY